MYKILFFSLVLLLSGCVSKDDIDIKDKAIEVTWDNDEETLRFSPNSIDKSNIEFIMDPMDKNVFLTFTNSEGKKVGKILYRREKIIFLGDDREAWDMIEKIRGFYNKGVTE